MIEPQQGFTIDHDAYRWGTLPGDIAGIGPLPKGSGYFHRDLPCRAIFEFAAAGVMLSAPASDRPVLSATYELAPPWLWRGKPDHWLDALRTRLGRWRLSGMRICAAILSPAPASRAGPAGTARLWTSACRSMAASARRNTAARPD